MAYLKPWGLILGSTVSRCLRAMLLPATKDTHLLCLADRSYYERQSLKCTQPVVQERGGSVHTYMIFTSIAWSEQHRTCVTAMAESA